MKKDCENRLNTSALQKWCAEILLFSGYGNESTTVDEENYMESENKVQI